MKIKFARSLLLIAMCVCSCRFGTNANETERTNAEKLHVAIYYESLCPDSFRFISKQLGAAYPILMDSIDVEFIPFGKSESFIYKNRTEFSCQHGPAECTGNKVQSCTLNELKNQPEKQIKYVVCQMDPSNEVYEWTGQACANTVNVTWANVEECFNGDTGTQLQLEAEKATHLIAKPYPSYVPTIVYNRVWDSNKQRRSLYNFKETVCHELVPLVKNGDLPSVCYANNPSQQ